MSQAHKRIGQRFREVFSGTRTRQRPVLLGSLQSAWVQDIIKSIDGMTKTNTHASFYRTHLSKLSFRLEVWSCTIRFQQTNQATFCAAGHISSSSSSRVESEWKFFIRLLENYCTQTTFIRCLITNSAKTNENFGRFSAAALSSNIHGCMDNLWLALGNVARHPETLCGCSRLLFKSWFLINCGNNSFASFCTIQVPYSEVGLRCKNTFYKNMKWSIN